MDFQKSNFVRSKFLKNSIIHKPSLGSLEVPQKNVGRIGLAVLTFIGYKQTNKQTDKPNLYIDEMSYMFNGKRTAVE